MSASIDLELKYAWAAGIIDGEGCISIRRSKLKGTGRIAYVLSVKVGQSGYQKPLMLIVLSELFGGSTHLAKLGTSKRRPCWDWDLVSAGAEAALRKVMPYLVEKRAQAEIAIAYREKALAKNGGRLTDLQKQAAENYYRALRDAKWTSK